MNIKQIQTILDQATGTNSVHGYAKIVSTKEFKQLPNLSVGNMADITYANPDKMSIKAHSAKKDRLTHKFVLFYTYNGMHKVISAGSLEELAKYLEKRIELHAAELAIVNS
jgi:hypothetical protein